LCIEARSSDLNAGGVGWMDLLGARFHHLGDGAVDVRQGSRAAAVKQEPGREQEVDRVLELAGAKR
jgi:hypothetical protein